MTKRTFYKTVIQVTVLSESPYDFDSLESVNYDIIEGDCSGDVDVVSTEELNGKQAADALLEQGSDPGFFRLNADGDDYDDEDDDLDLNDPPVDPDDPSDKNE